jgi:hypothetical protein
MKAHLQSNAQQEGSAVDARVTRDRQSGNMRVRESLGRALHPTHVGPPATAGTAEWQRRVKASAMPAIYVAFPLTGHPTTTHPGCHSADATPLEHQHSAFRNAATATTHTIAATLNCKRVYWSTTQHTYVTIHYRLHVKKGEPHSGANGRLTQVYNTLPPLALAVTVLAPLLSNTSMAPFAKCLGKHFACPLLPQATPHYEVTSSTPLIHHGCARHANAKQAQRQPTKCHSDM